MAAIIAQRFVEVQMEVEENAASEAVAAAAAAHAGSNGEGMDISEVDEDRYLTVRFSMPDCV